MIGRSRARTPFRAYLRQNVVPRTTELPVSQQHIAVSNYVALCEGSRPSADFVSLWFGERLLTF